MQEIICKGLWRRPGRISGSGTSIDWGLAGGERMKLTSWLRTDLDGRPTVRAPGAPVHFFRSVIRVDGECAAPTKEAVPPLISKRSAWAVSETCSAGAGKRQRA